MTTLYQPAPPKALPEPGTRLIDDDDWVEVYARSTLPTRFGDFQILVFRNSLDDKEHTAVVHGDCLLGAESLLVRLHSECLTGDVFGSLRCDCRAQLERSLEAIHRASRGVILYLRQEGRGIGLGNKIRAYRLQEAGMDTYAANEHLGFSADARDYRVAALILRLLGVRSVSLATNNPRKIFGLKSNGVDVVGREAVVTPRNPHNATYLNTKAEHGHLLPRE